MSATLLGTAERVARKEHACYWCRVTVAAGDTFYEARVAEDGRLDTWRAHVECRAAEAAAFNYRASYRMSDEPACWATDYDGGSHERGKNCPDCSDIPVATPAPPDARTNEEK